MAEEEKRMIGNVALTEKEVQEAVTYLVCEMGNYWFSMQSKDVQPALVISYWYKTKNQK